MKDIPIPLYLSESTKKMVREGMDFLIKEAHQKEKNKEEYIEQWTPIKVKMEADFEKQFKQAMEWIEKNNDPFGHIKKWDQMESRAQEMEDFWEYCLKWFAMECTKFKNNEGLDAVIDMKVLNLKKTLQSSPYRKGFEVEKKDPDFMVSGKDQKEWMILFDQEEKEKVTNKIWVWDRHFLHNVRNCAVEMGDVDRMEWLFNHPVLIEREKQWKNESDKYPSLLEDQARWYSLNLNEKKEEDAAGLFFCTACEHGYLEMVKWFFNSPGLELRKQKEEHLNLSKTTYLGYKPIRVAAKNHHWDVVKWLLSSPESQKAAADKPFVLGINIHAYYDGLLVSVAKDHSESGLEMLKFFWEDPAWNEWKKSHPDQHIELENLDERFWKEVSDQAMKWIWRSDSVQRPEVSQLKSLDKIRMDIAPLNHEMEHWVTLVEEGVLLEGLEKDKPQINQEEALPHPKMRL